jgi:hypothetical protein
MTGCGPARLAARGGSFATVGAPPKQQIERERTDTLAASERLGTFGPLPMRPSKSDMERLTRSLERTAAPLLRFASRGGHNVLTVGERRGRAAVAQLGRWAAERLRCS